MILGFIKHVWGTNTTSFLLSLGGGEGFCSFLFCSHQVPNMFPIITLHFNPFCFAQSPPLLTYIAGPKGETHYLSIESFTLGRLHSFNIFFNGPIRLAHCKKIKNSSDKILRSWHMGDFA